MSTIFTSAWRAAPKSVSAGTTLCAIGDVHGCITLLRDLVDHLRTGVPLHGRTGCLVLIGDYVDRGPASLETLAYVAELALPGWEIVRLLGNHDFFLALIVGEEVIDAAFVEAWLDVGGESTFAELGLRREDVFRLDLEDLRARLRSRLPPGTTDLLARLAASHRVGDYLFVHAGLDPTTPIDAHDVSDLVMIREPFLAGTGWAHDVTVIHGHTIRGHEALPHRIAIDTGAFRTGLLSCVQLEDDRLRWIVASASGHLEALGGLKRSDAEPMRYDEPARS